MLYVVMLCYISSGSCFIGKGDPVFSYFNTLAACERMAQIHNQGHLRTVIDMRAECFEKPGWQPVRRSQLEDQSGPNNAEATRLLNENEYRKSIAPTKVDVCLMYGAETYSYMKCRTELDKP